VLGRALDGYSRVERDGVVVIPPAPGQIAHFAVQLEKLDVRVLLLAQPGELPVKHPKWRLGAVNLGARVRIVPGQFLRPRRQPLDGA
jgi:hypothetical protein